MSPYTIHTLLNAWKIAAIQDPNPFAFRGGKGIYRGENRGKKINTEVFLYIIAHLRSQMYGLTTRIEMLTGFFSRDYSQLIDFNPLRPTAPRSDSESHIHSQSLAFCPLLISLLWRWGWGQESNNPLPFFSFCPH